MNVEVTAESLRAIQINADHDCKIKLAIIGYRSTTMASTFLIKSLYEKGLSVELYQGKYNQVEPEILNENSDLILFNPDVIVLYNSLEALRKQWFTDQSNLAENVISHFRQLLKVLEAKLPTVTLIHENYELDTDGVYDSADEKSFLFQVQKINAQLTLFETPKLNSYRFDKAAFMAYHGLKNCRNNGMLHTVDLPYTSQTEALISWELAEVIAANFGRSKKCLILDLDNTLWGGVIGEDGLDGIQLGGKGNGYVFAAIQQWVLALKESGIILAICSKNSLEMAQEPFLNHPDMLLSLTDFAVFMANWSTKSENIKLIKETLNIGYDAIVFLDDNPVERELVQRTYPEITVPNLPADVAALPDFLRHLHLFSTVNRSKQTIDRTAFFAQNEARKKVDSSPLSLDDYLKGLLLKARLSILIEANIDRVSELSLRSNQFNLRTQRYTVTALRELLKNPSYTFQTIELEDKFGSYGLIAVMVLRKENNQSLFIENWFMSCRAIQRGVEELMLNKIVDFCKRNGIEKLVGEYLPTSKNEVVANHFPNMGFRPVNALWELKIATYEPKTVVISVI